MNRVFKLGVCFLLTACGAGGGGGGGGNCGIPSGNYLGYSSQIQIAGCGFTYYQEYCVATGSFNASNGTVRVHTDNYNGACGNVPPDVECSIDMPSSNAMILSCPNTLASGTYGRQ